MSYIVRTHGGSILKVTPSLNEAMKTANEFREMKGLLGEDAHCDVEERVIVYSTKKKEEDTVETYELEEHKKPSPFRNF